MADSKPDPSGYNPIFVGELPGNKNKKPIPKWVPVALLAFSSAALIVPIVMLRRHRAATLGKALADAPPPPRRTVSKGIPMANPTTKPPVFSIRDPVPSTSTSASSSMAAKAEDNFNGALHSAKAFGIATLMVGAGAAATVYGVRQYMGVQTTHEFANRMRDAILTRMPSLSARIYRPPKAEDGDPLLLPDPPEESSSTLDAAEEWSWPEAERRLREAFDKHGFYGWAAAAMHELEAEGRIERAKRGHV
ncbi:hypothetical protein DICSQDRAFT_173240 [Dichomitus squalens LYAD-421 SS1]|uniref:Transmembrane protein 242 n=1 Tax=Dichomitus squalens (strain LYAD-421) TaxID=732165 RepID=R7SPP5_DICSQ|nr:uncharacterized protein DICSQDRAFT_173240 [Dichomitus squalens LYAD-421 SS1]EJF58149.1 hypothetical protein DICSQDRAFT_173240 [Dichomitus squalens LYAD-421 SS1]